jgi:hypothetical protein
MKTGLLAVGLVVVGVMQTAAAELASVATWGGPGSESVEATAVARDGSVYVTGTTSSFVDESESGSSIFLIKYDGEGSLEWQRRWSDPAPFFSDTAADVAVDSEGNVYVVGTTVADGRGNDVLILKFDPSGNLLWQKSWGGSGASQDIGASVAIGPDGEVYVAGTAGFDNPQAILLKFAPDGRLLWQQSYTGGGSATAKALAVDAAGTIFLVGTSPRPDFFTDTVLVQFSPAGAVLGATAFSAGEITDPENVTVAGDGGVHVVGAIDGSLSAFVARFNPDLTLDWARDIDGRSGERANAVAVAGDGTIWVVGSTNTASASDEAFIVQMSDRGRVLQANTWGGPRIDHGVDLGFSSNGNVIVGAVTEGGPSAFLKSRLKAGRLRGEATVAADTVGGAAGTVVDSNGVVSIPDGSTRFAGSTDAALLTILP